MSLLLKLGKYSILLLLSCFVNAKSEQMDVGTIIKKAELAAYYAGNDGRTAARMMIVDSNGRKQMRQFIILRKDREEGGAQDMLVFFSRPADVKGTVFRVVKHNEGEDDRWLYLPDLDLVKRISAGDKRTSFVGAHFYYEDVSGRGIEKDIFALETETDEQYVITAMPKKPEEVEFKSYKVWIDKQTFLPVKIEYTNNKEMVYRRVEAVKVQNIAGYPTVTESKVSDLQNGGYTLMQFRFTTYNLGLPDDIFSERSLRTPPHKWLSVSK
ncbi:outer membrane lipoprotein-sorting protein [Flocculibacter collagenilyticus]|uniref:outer membrane lipoprotein-sorting protein n=1 Tax=Flocculibacter collagenilyticus TaxID=2744479 RepID=UPI0018F3DD19|nr:outer membrane lipoprotein-sorting protein [Flocculibacter collagenilyticus]